MITVIIDENDPWGVIEVITWPDRGDHHAARHFRSA